tara:strand:- start:604 stop:942 length:339 start_codon:yes stop_codon:yes gene_type:complete
MKSYKIRLSIPLSTHYEVEVTVDAENKEDAIEAAKFEAEEHLNVHEYGGWGRDEHAAVESEEDHVVITGMSVDDSIDPESPEIIDEWDSEEEEDSSSEEEESETSSEEEEAA